LTVIRVPRDPVISPGSSLERTRSVWPTNAVFKDRRGRSPGPPDRSLKTQQHRARPPRGKQAAKPAAHLSTNAPDPRSGRHSRCRARMSAPADSCD